MLDDAEQTRIDEALRPLADPEMREIARRIMVKEASAKKDPTPLTPLFLLIIVVMDTGGIISRINTLAKLPLIHL
ncbi:MAG: hypothetical protein A2Y65_05905 [Deltaproteobacteria bacterium RBG_13_52_11]|nr:MAG: hypothetical protein A2Y65_05905 [Deltaproteobacteria bacterium RBG_13_52_11]